MAEQVLHAECHAQHNSPFRFVRPLPRHVGRGGEEGIVFVLAAGGPDVPCKFQGVIVSARVLAASVPRGSLRAACRRAPRRTSKRPLQRLRSVYLALWRLFFDLLRRAI